MTQDINPQPSSTAEREETAVAHKGLQISDMVWYVGGAVAVFAIIAANFSDSFSSSEDTAPITQQQDEQYRVVKNASEPLYPKQARSEPEIKQAPIDPMLLQYQLRMEELQRKKDEAAAQLAEARKRSPMLVYSSSSKGSRGDSFVGGSAGSGVRASNGLDVFGGSNGGQDDGLYDGNQRSHVARVMAGRLPNQDWTIAQGTTIRGVLESAIQSDLAGYIRAIVSEDIHSFDGSRVLVPRGSKVIGRYQSGLKQSQSRLFVVWQRIIRPDGIDIMVDSPGTDTLGRMGLGGNVDSHFMQRFGSAILLSMIDGALQAGVNSVNDSDAQTVVSSAGGGLSRSAEIALENSINIRPTIHVDQGTPINIFVTKDMDFSNTRPKERSLSWWK